MKKLKHSKYKNTGIIFEILTRGIVNEALNNKKSSKSLNIVKKYFNAGSELYKELKFYQALQEVNPKIRNADKLIDLVIETYNTKIDRNKLASEKYNIIGEIKNHYDLNTFFSSRLTNYTLLASIYKIFEYSASENPSDHMNCRDCITENILGENQEENILNEVQTMWKNENPDIKKLAYKVIVDKFNEKYQGLNERQKVLLKKIINEDTKTDEFRDFIYEEVSKVRKQLRRISSGIDSEVMRIKLDEVINLTDLIVSSNTIKDEHLSSMLKYYELVEELS